MAATLTMIQNKKALFDPGFKMHLMAFLPMIQTMQNELSNLKTPEQKKLRFRILSRSSMNALESTLGYWIGCILWCGYLKYNFYNDPQPIVGNQFLTMPKEDVVKISTIELSVMQKYIETYPQNVLYYTGESDCLPNYYIKILEEYKNFLEINNYFSDTRMTSDIKVPDKIALFEQYNEVRMERLHKGIMQILDKGDLRTFLTIYFMNRL